VDQDYMTRRAGYSMGLNLPVTALASRRVIALSMGNQF
jgi:hypothetical protein